MLKQVMPLVLIAAVSACSTPLDRRQANDVEKYRQKTDIKVEPELIIPEGLSSPVFSKEYDIPSLGAKARPELVGELLDIRPPLQVLPMAEGTHVEETAENIKIVIESIDNSLDLKQEIFDVLKGFLAQKEIGIRNDSYQLGTIETQWIEHEQVLESNLWGADKAYLLRQRYRFDIDIRPHGRSGNVIIHLVEHEEHFDGKEKDVLLNGEDKRRYTIDMLNNAIAYMSVKRQQIIQANRIKQSRGIDVDLVSADEEQAYWLAEAPYKLVWERLRTVLPEMGFEILDLDISKGLFYVDFNDDSGFWSSLWGDARLPLKAGKYRLLIEDGAEPLQTKIMLRDDGDEPVDNATMTEAYQVLADLMKEDRKVR